MQKGRFNLKKNGITITKAYISFHWQYQQQQPLYTFLFYDTHSSIAFWITTRALNVQEQVTIMRKDVDDFKLGGLRD